MNTTKGYIFLLIVLFLSLKGLKAQDLLDDGDVLEIEEFRGDLNNRFSFGNIYTRLSNEDPEDFVIRILDEKGNLLISNHIPYGSTLKVKKNKKIKK